MKTTLALLCIFLPLLASTAHGQSITVTPNATDGGTPVLVKWDVPGALACAASGLWVGSRAASGQNMVTPTASGKYTLTCTMPTGLGRATVSWSPPTQNTDGTALTDLTGYKIYFGASSGTLAKSVQIAPDLTTYTVEGIAAGPTSFAMASLTPRGESAMSNVAKSTVVASAPAPVVISADVTVTSLPKPPTNLTATATAYEYRPATNSFAAIGLVAPGRSCGPTTKTVGAATYCRVALADSLPVLWPQDRSITEVWVKR